MTRKIVGYGLIILPFVALSIIGIIKYGWNILHIWLLIFTSFFSISSGLQILSSEWFPTKEKLDENEDHTV
jgi:hypothetical protein